MTLGCPFAFSCFGNLRRGRASKERAPRVLAPSGETQFAASFLSWQKSEPQESWGTIYFPPKKAVLLFQQHCRISEFLGSERCWSSLIVVIQDGDMDLRGLMRLEHLSRGSFSLERKARCGLCTSSVLRTEEPKGWGSST